MTTVTPKTRRPIFTACLRPDPHPAALVEGVTGWAVCC